MSFGFRKSFGSGPFRFTASKSGVSSSFGVRGARITTGPRGTYISVSAYGLHYRERIGHIGASGRRTTGANFTTDSAEDTIRTAHTTDLVDSSSEKLLTALNNRAQMVNPAIFAWVVSALLLACSAEIGRAHV